MISTKMLGLLAATFAAGAFFASPLPEAIAAVIATDVQCTGCVGTSDLAGNAVTAAKIKDNEIKSAEIATDAVGGSELQGVTQILFAKCGLTNTEGNMLVMPSSTLPKTCNITGVAVGDLAIASFNNGSNCFVPSQVSPTTNQVLIQLINACNATTNPIAGSYISLIVYRK